MLCGESSSRSTCPAQMDFVKFTLECVDGEASEQLRSLYLERCHVAENAKTIERMLGLLFPRDDLRDLQDRMSPCML